MLLNAENHLTVLTIVILGYQKNNIIGVVRRVFFFANTVHVASELLAWAATFNSL